MKYLSLAVAAAMALPAISNAATLTVVSAQADVSLGQASLTASPSETRVELERNEPGRRGRAFTDLSNGTIGVETEVVAGANLVDDFGGGGSFLFEFDLDTPGALLPAGLFELEVEGRITQAVGPAPVSTFLNTINAGISVTLTDRPAGDVFQAVSAGVLGLDSDTGAPVFETGFEVLIGDAPNSLTPDGFFTASLSSKEFSFLDFSSPTFPGFPNLVEISFGVGTGVSNGAESSLLFFETAKFRINDTLGINVAGAPNGILVSNDVTTPAPVQLPAGFPLLLAGVAGLVMLRRRSA